MPALLDLQIKISPGWIYYQDKNITGRDPCQIGVHQHSRSASDRLPVILPPFFSGQQIIVFWPKSLFSCKKKVFSGQKSFFSDQQIIISKPIKNHSYQLMSSISCVMYFKSWLSICCHWLFDFFKKSIKINFQFNLNHGYLPVTTDFLIY